MNEVTDHPELRAILALSRCHFFPGSWAKRFCKDMHDRYVVGNRVKPLSPKQKKTLWKLVWQYRNQIKDSSLREYALTQLDEFGADQSLLLLAEECSDEQRKPRFPHQQGYPGEVGDHPG